MECKSKVTFFVAGGSNEKLLKNTSFMMNFGEKINI
jgi:hypothetical protein